MKFFVSTKAVDRRALAGAGESANGIELPAVGWRGILRAGSFFLHLLGAVQKAGAAMREFRADALLAMGGFVSGASIGAARRKKIPYFLHESNAIPGRATKLLSRGAQKVFVGFQECAGRLPGASAVFTGTPVRQRLGGMGKEEALNHRLPIERKAEA